MGALSQGLHPLWALDMPSSPLHRSGPLADTTLGGMGLVRTEAASGPVKDRFAVHPEGE